MEKSSETRETSQRPEVKHPVLTGSTGSADGFNTVLINRRWEDEMEI